MKKLILTLTASLACVAAFAQGKVSFQNDSLHLAYYGNVAPADASLASQPVSSALMPAGVTLVSDMYLGTSSTSLSLVSSTAFSATPGKWSAVSVLPAGTTGGEVVFIVAQVRDNSVAAESTFIPGTTSGVTVGGKYWGSSQVIQFTLGSAVTYPVLWGANGNWQAGSYVLGGGNLGAVAVNVVPEPASFALAGLGLAAVTIFRRRK